MDDIPPPPSVYERIEDLKVEIDGLGEDVILLQGHIKLCAEELDILYREINAK